MSNESVTPTKIAKGKAVFINPDPKTKKTTEDCKEVEEETKTEKSITPPAKAYDNRNQESSEFNLIDENGFQSGRDNKP